MSILQAFWLGLVQGLTEFLPVSSSGHLLLLGKVFGIANSSLTFEVLLHVGTLLAVVAIYWKRIVNLFVHPLKSELLYLVVATIPAVIAALLINFEDAFAGEYLGFSFLLTTLILWLADLVGGLAPKVKNVNWANAIVMGIMQALAILPGVSRSGSTISGGVATGLSRKRASDFAFMMSIPAIIGSVVLELKGALETGFFIAESEVTAVIVGVVTAAVSGFLAIKLMLAIVRRVRLTWFGLYTGLLGVLVLLDQYVFHYVFTL
ncbi:MAG: undecaprenyl-diphosphate phosphatase [Clostridia bacterium]|nr:undecaprenyl-diphosphate phosphatase [Clostridia bacterium]